MRKITASIEMKYRFNSTRKRARYTLNDGKTWLNNGEFAEAVTKSVLGFKPTKNANTAYDKASDIPDMGASVKSSRFTLVNAKLAESLENSIERYFETTCSKIWIYTVITGNTATLYFMDRMEFKEFLQGFTKLNERGFVRSRATGKRMIGWFEGQMSPPLEPDASKPPPPQQRQNKDPPHSIGQKNKSRKLLKKLLTI